jgi:formiminotetrahydrofolate cyclodeaminase
VTWSDGYARMPVGGFLDALADATRAPAAGSAAALAVAQAAALCAKAARLSSGQLSAARSGQLAQEADIIRTQVVRLVDEDPRAFGAVIKARRAIAAGVAEPDSLAIPLSHAADVPVLIAEHADTVAELAVPLAAHGNSALRGDVVAAVILAEAGARAAAVLVHLNLADSPDDARHAVVDALLTRIAAAVRAIDRTLAG